jgi:hypothetical protein
MYPFYYHYLDYLKEIEKEKYNPPNLNSKTLNKAHILDPKAKVVSL